MSKKVIIIGGGYTGLAAAYDLQKAGNKVTIFEASNEIGGLAGHFEPQPGVKLEKFYHHWFTSDTAIIDFIKEIGLGSKLKYMSSQTGLFYANSIFRLSKPADLLKFKPLSLLSRIKTGLMVLSARRVKDWHKLESISAEEWIIKHAGKEAYDVIWGPLLRGKFGDELQNVSAVWIWNKFKLRGASRNKKGDETLVYYEGGFGGATGDIQNKLREIGVDIRLGHKVDHIISEYSKFLGVVSKGMQTQADVCLATLPLPEFLKIAPLLPNEYRDPAAKIRFLGNVCLILRLKKSLSSTYWLNVADPDFPYVGIIEHTNFDKIENYKGEHIAYLSKYLPVKDPLYKMSDEEVFKTSLPHIKKMFPDFSDDWVIGYHVWRANYSQPIVTKHYSELIPKRKTPIENLWLSTMAQIYPQDRGTNYAVLHGREVANDIKLAMKK